MRALEGYRRTRAGPHAHWRRGHWRNQAHRPQLSLRKLIWIRPTLVAADHAGAADEATPPPGQMR